MKKDKTVAWNKRYETYEYNNGEKITIFRDSYDAKEYADKNGLKFKK